MLTVDNLEERCEPAQVLFTEQSVAADATSVTDTLCKKAKDVNLSSIIFHTLSLTNK